MVSLEFLRQFHAGDYAIFDLTVAFLGIFLLSPLLSKMFLKIGVYIPRVNWIFLTLPIGILVHVLIGSMTPMTKQFFSWPGNFWLKVSILTLLILGLRGIKIINKNKK